jgi:hypothetical protein
MPTQLAVKGSPLTIIASATGAALATGPAADLVTPIPPLSVRNGILLIMPLGAAQATLAAPSILVRLRGTTEYYDVGGIDRLTGSDLILPADVGRAISVRDWLAWGDRLWVKSATVTGSVKVLFIPLETVE